MQKKILVTGGAGFIGSHTIVELFNQGYYPIVVDNFVNSSKTVLEGIRKVIQHPVKYYEIDCKDKKELDKVFQLEKDIVGVIHFAAYKAVGESVQNPLKYYINNLQSLTVLLEVMEKFEVNTLVFSSSCTVYGQPTSLPVDENVPIQIAQSPYGNTKQIGEEIIQDVVKATNKLKAISLRYFNPIGAHPSGAIGELPLGIPNNLVPFITQTAACIRPVLQIFGNDYATPDGTCIRDYLHVVDLAKAHVKALEFLENQHKSCYHVYNVGTGKGNSVWEVIKAFEKVTGQKVNYTIAPRRSGDIAQVYANTDKIKIELQWQPTYTLEDALKDAWQWQKNLKALSI